MTQISEATAIYLGTTAVDKVYLGEALIWSAAPPPAMTAELAPVINDWTALDLAASLPASVGFPTFAITSGSLPAGYTLDPASGMLSGVSTTGQEAASVTVTAGAAETVVSIAAPRREIKRRPVVDDRREFRRHGRGRRRRPDKCVAKIHLIDCGRSKVDCRRL